jgi:hypothetical protein
LIEFHFYRVSAEKTKEDPHVMFTYREKTHTREGRL